jgi:hypothetical protein
MADKLMPPPVMPTSVAEPKKKLQLVFEMDSVRALSNYLGKHHMAEIIERFPDGQGDWALFTLELLKRLEGRTS